MDLARAAASVDMASEMSDAEILAPVHVYCFLIDLLFEFLEKEWRKERLIDIVRSCSFQVVKKEEFSHTSKHKNATIS